MIPDGKTLRRGLACSVLGFILIAAPAVAPDENKKKPVPKRFRGIIGPHSKKVKVVDGKTLLWASGNPDSADSTWYDFTGSPIPPEDLQFGIGQDSIRSIDDPLFVKPNDPRLLKIRPSPYRRDERPKTNDEIMVIGFVEGKDARAYPAALLDGHVLVYDKIGGKPVTVGW